MAEITLQNLVFPEEPPYQPAYTGSDADSSGRLSDGSLEITAGKTATLLSYFNAFFSLNYYRHWGVRRVTFYLRVSGAGQAGLCTYPANNNEPGARKASETKGHPHATPSGQRLGAPLSFNSDGVTELAFSVDLDDRLSTQIIYPEITAGEKGAVLHGGRVTAEVEHLQKIHLAVVICTFHKEEFIKATAEALCHYDFPGDITVHIIDNGRSLNPADFSHPRLRLIPNPNYGGAGGFGRGLLEAVENEEFTHILFMDDDVKIEPDAIFRTMAVHQLAGDDTQPYALCGSMLDFDNPAFHFEGGAWFEPGKMKYVRVHGSVDLKDPAQLATLGKPKDIGYGGWWYFSVSLADVRKSQMHIPFFIRGDDIEFSYNLRKELGTRLLVQPGIGLWHVAFGKDPLWLMYYTMRNNLGLGALHYTGRMRRNFLTSIPAAIFIGGWQMRYGYVEQMLDGIQDFLKGPAFLRELKADDFHDQLRKKVGADSDLETKQMDDDGNYRNLFENRPQPKAYGYWVYLRALLTFNGQILPGFLLSKKPGISDLNDHVRFKIAQCYASGSHIAFDHQNGTLQIRTKNLGRLLRIFLRAAFLLPWALFIYGRVVRRWQKEIPQMRTTGFWRNYLGVGN